MKLAIKFLTISRSTICHYILALVFEPWNVSANVKRNLKKENEFNIAIGFLKLTWRMHAAEIYPGKLNFRQSRKKIIESYVALIAIDRTKNSSVV